MATLYPPAIQLPRPHPENYMQGRWGTPISEIVEHHTACSLRAAEDTFWAAPASGRQHSAHVIIDKDGTVYQIMDFEDTAYGAANWDANLRGIQKEHVSFAPGDPGYDVFPDAQYNASGLFNRWACATFGFPEDANHDRPHNYYIQTTCPGALDLARIIQGGILDMLQDERDALFFIKSNLQNVGDLLTAVNGITLAREEGEILTGFKAVEAMLADLKTQVAAIPAGGGGGAEPKTITLQIDAIPGKAAGTIT